MAQVFTGHGITMFQLAALKMRMGLEMKGLKARGQTTYSYLKQRFGFKGTRQKVYEQFCQYIEEQAKLLQPGDIEDTSA